MKNFLLSLMSILTFLIAENVIVTYSSTEPVSGIQFNFTGGGTFTTPYASPTNPANGQPTDLAPQFYNAITVTSNGLVIMFDFQGASIPSTSGTAYTLLTLENSGGSDICIDIENDFLDISDTAGNSIGYATVDPDNCLHLIVSNVVSGCTNEVACNYNPEATADNGTCLVPDSSACESCSGSTIVTNDDDSDGICNDEDDCFGTEDDCGECNGDGSTCLPQDIIVTYSSTEPVSGIQFNFTGGGTFTTPYASPINPFNGQPTDLAPQFYNAITVTSNGLVIMFDFQGASIPSTSGTAYTLLTLENSGGSDICIDIENDFLDISDTAGNSIGYATVDPDNCLHLIVSNVVSGCTNEAACNYNPDATAEDGTCLVPNVARCESCSGTTIVTNDDDSDGICNDEDDCFGTEDDCGECNGDGSTCLPQDIIVTYSSTEPVSGIQFNFTGGGTFTTPYASPILIHLMVNLQI